MHTDTLRPLRDAFRRKCPEKRRTNFWFLLHDNAPAHLSVLVKDFLAEKNTTTVAHLSSSPDLAADDFYLFPQLKSAPKGRRWRFCDNKDIIKNAIEELQRISQNGFQEGFHQIYSRWQNCIVAQGDHFGGNAA
jgi:hypothetical protein